MLAVSGGPDSMALLHLVAAWRPPGLPITVASVDHGLRPEAALEAAAVVATAHGLDLPATLLRWEGEKPSTRLQARARAARYDLLATHARAFGAQHIVTAHTLDDQAETLLMRLAAGSGPRGLAGMLPCSVWDGMVVARPLLGVRKAALVALCRSAGWAFFDDPSNHAPRFARARWRALAPMLGAEGLTPERLATLATRLARAERALEAATQTAAVICAGAGEHGTRRFSQALWDQPDELVLRLLAAALQDVAPESPHRLAKLEGLLVAFRQARQQGLPLRRTLQGCLVALDRHGCVSVGIEGPRKAASPARAANLATSLNAKR
ncbi:tRNA lysidine(34) synthetase TilS [Lichenihabitans sp. Uapishka_5]|nr:tRNA lysidine(34) synthetase TilS [Lichenihabitans sp. Uapishka_5]MDX7952441.1 tRNA lysidine(34) synthetase TilS [Lichenihabitans sp. Uapishka_5]